MDKIEKICKSCLVSKSITEFNKNKAYADGMDYRCKVCYKNKVKSKKRYPLANVYKLCKKCGIDKPVYDFKKCKKTEEGYRGNCKTCRNNKPIDYSHIESKVCPKCKKLKHYNEYHVSRREKMV